MEEGGDAVDCVAGAVFGGFKLVDLSGYLADSFAHDFGVGDSVGKV